MKCERFLRNDYAGPLRLTAGQQQRGEAAGYGEPSKELAFSLLFFHRLNAGRVSLAEITGAFFTVRAAV